MGLKQPQARPFVVKNVLIPLERHGEACGKRVPAPPVRSAPRPALVPAAPAAPRARTGGSGAAGGWGCKEGTRGTGLPGHRQRNFPPRAKGWGRKLRSLEGSLFHNASLPNTLCDIFPQDNVAFLVSVVAFYFIIIIIFGRVFLPSRHAFVFFMWSRYFILLPASDAVATCTRFYAILVPFPCFPVPRELFFFIFFSPFSFRDCNH